jgi:hypothetical protein
VDARSRGASWAVVGVDAGVILGCIASMRPRCAASQAMHSKCDSLSELVGIDLAVPGIALLTSDCDPSWHDRVKQISRAENPHSDLCRIPVHRCTYNLLKTCKFSDVFHADVSSLIIPRGRKLVAHSTKALNADIATGPEVSVPTLLALSVEFSTLSWLDISLSV